MYMYVYVCTPWISQLPDLGLTSRVAQKKEESGAEAIKGY
jgi:hypothetical protein